MNVKGFTVILLPFLLFYLFGLHVLTSDYPFTRQYLPDFNKDDIEKGYTEVTYTSPLDYAPRAILELGTGFLLSLMLYEADAKWLE